MSQERSREASKKWSMSGHAVKTELKGHANGLDIHIKKSVKDSTRLSAPEQFRLSYH